MKRALAVDLKRSRYNACCHPCFAHHLSFPKCDSKHPRCTACTNAGTGCHQEDRHRQTLTPRGHTEKIERQLAQCEALLKRRLEGFHLDNLEEFMIRDGLDPDVTPPAPPGFVPYSHPGPGGFVSIRYLKCILLTWLQCPSSSSSTTTTGRHVSSYL